MVRDATLHVQAICDKELKTDYFINSNIKLFISSTIILPAFFIVVVCIGLRTFHLGINEELKLRRNHGNFASLIVVGIFSQLAILGFDTAAIAYVLRKDYEYKDYNVQHTINMFITFITFGVDVVFTFAMLLCILYLWCTLCHEDSSKNCKPCAPVSEKCLSCLPYCIIPCFYAVFGDKKHGKIWNNPNDYDDIEDSKKLRTSWVLLIILVSPLFSIASHGSYVLAAWLTEPSKATETALIAIATVIYAALVFRQCYIANIEIKFQEPGWSIWILFSPIVQCLENCSKLYYTYRDYHKEKSGNDNGESGNDSNRGDDNNSNGGDDNDSNGGDDNDSDDNDSNGGRGMDSNDLESYLINPKGKSSKELFNTQAICVVICWGFLLVGSLAFTIVAFYEVPFKTLGLATYLLNLFQIFIVVMTALITYKIFILSEPDLHRFLNKVRTTFEIKKRPGNAEYDDLEEVAVITGCVLDSMITQPAN